MALRTTAPITGQPKFLSLNLPHQFEDYISLGLVTLIFLGALISLYFVFRRPR